ncbi:MAG: phosphate regulon sensor histidine kinase PhoR [Pseudomonadota bacterium]
MKWSPLEWTLAGSLLGLALILGAVTGAWPLMLLLALVCWVALQYRELAALVRWSRHPISRPENRLESWQMLADRLYRSLRAARRRTARTLEASRGLRVVTDALPDAAVIVDRDGRIEGFNSAARERLQLERSDRGANLASLVRHPDFMTLVKGEHAEGLVEFPSPFDDQRRLEARRIPVDGRYALILVRDVTQLNRLLTMRQDFVANVSHELRTPLTVIVGYLESLEDEDLDPEMVRDLLGKLESPTARMRALVDDLLLLSRLEASALPRPEELQAIDMATLARDCVAEASVLSDGRHEFRVSADPGLRLLGMTTEMHSAVLNLVTNAVRYSPDGGVVRVGWERLDNGGARLWVSDQGIGIAPEHRERLTERFYRVDLARSRVRGGTGLGLAIVKHVLKRHRSALRVDSEPGKGSTFHCEFPAAQILVTSDTPSKEQET